MLVPVHPNILTGVIGPLAATWVTDKMVHSSSEEERLRRVSSLLWKGRVNADDIHFVGKRGKGDRDPMFLHVEFPVWRRLALSESGPIRSAT